MPAASCSESIFTPRGTESQRSSLTTRDSHLATRIIPFCFALGFLCASVVNEFSMRETQLEARSPKLETDLRDLAQDIVRRAMSGGATAAECVIREGDEFSTLVRLGQVETLKESGSKSIGVRVFFGQRAASTYSSDFSREGLDRMVTSALTLAKITSED